MNALLWRAVEAVFAGEWPAGFVARSTVLLVVAWLLNAALRQVNPRWRVLLWRGTAVSALVLLLLGLARPVVSLAFLPAVARSATYRVAEEATLASEPAQLERDRLVAWERDRAVEASYPSVAQSGESVYRPATAGQAAPQVASRVPQDAAAATVTPWSLASFLWLAWGLGVGIAAGRNVLAVADLRRLRRGAKRASDSIVKQAGEIAVRLGFSRPFEVLETSELQSPCVMGVWHAALLLPAAPKDSAADDGLAAVLAHEIEHLRNADLAWNAVLLALSSLYWFHPLVWRMRSAHAAACDAVCDAAAANVLGDVEAYCRTLAELALRAWSRRSEVSLAMARPSSVRRRIVALRRCHYAAGLPRVGVVIALFVGLSIAGLLGTTRLIRAENEAETKSAATKEQETAPIPAGETSKPQAPLAIHGKISDASGKPVVGAYVQVYAPWSNYPKCCTDCGKHVTTDGEGRFSIDGLKPKFKFRLAVAADGYRSRFIDNVDPAADQLVEAALAARVMPDDPARVVRGVVVGPDGEPAVGATVVPFGCKAGGKRWWGNSMPPDVLAETDDAGKFMLVCDQAVDALDLHVEARGAARRNFALVESGASDNRLTLERGTTVRGRVAHDGQGVPGVAVGLSQVQRGIETHLGPYATETDAEGRFTFADVPRDQAMVVYGSMDSLRGIGALPFKPIESGSVDSSDLGDLPVTEAHRVTGRVVLADGKALPEHTRVVISREHAWDSTFVEAGADGSFAFSGIPAELVTLDIHNLWGLGYRMSPKNGSFEALNGMGLEGLVSADVEGLTVLVEPGKPLRPNFRRFDKAEQNRTEHDRRIRQEPLTGVLPDLQAPPGAIALADLGDDDLGRKLPPRPVPKIEVPPPAPRPVFPPADATPARIVSGTVKDAEGKPLADAQVWLPVRVVREHEILTAKTRTDDLGRFQLSVPEAWQAKPEQSNELLWNVWAYAPGHGVGEGHAGRQLLGAAADEPLVITLPAESDIVLIIRSSDGKPAAGAKVIPCDEADRVMRNFPRELSEKLLAETADAEGIVHFKAINRESRHRPYFAIEFAGHGRQTFDADMLVSDGRQAKFQPMAREQRVDLSRVGRIEGRIVGEQLELVRGRTVLVESDGQMPRGQPKLTGVAEATIGDDGRFVIPEIAAGQLRVFVKCDKRLAVQPRPPKLFDLSVEAGKTLELEIPLEQCVHVHGLVRVKQTGDPVAGARVWINGRWLHNQGPSVVTDEKGEYSAYVLGGDNWDKVDLEVDEHALVDYVQLSDSRARHAVPAGVDDFELPAIEMARAVKVSGLLLDAEGKPLADARLLNLVDKRAQGVGNSDQEGRFAIGRAPAGIPVERFLVFSGDKRWHAETESTDPLVVRVKREATNDD